MTNNRLKIIHEGLRKIVSLESINLDFDDADVTDDGLKDLMLDFTTLHSLNHIKIRFHGFTAITNEGLKNLNQGLKKITSLQTLSLHFMCCCSYPSCPNMSPKYLIEDFSQLTSLKTVDLSLDWFIDDQGFMFLAKNLYQLPALKDCTIRFLAYKITGMSFGNRANFFTKLTSLRTLRLTLVECDDFSDEGLMALNEGLKRLLKLKKLHLLFASYDLIILNDC